MISRVIEMARRVIDEAGFDLSQVQAIGIGCGGPLDPDRGVVINALNNPGWINVPLVERVRSALGPPTYLDNDANAAALGEHRFGAGRGIDNMVYLTISTGVGGGVILDGRLRHGENGNAGELGHIAVCYEGRRCHCGGVGCLEAYVSGTSIGARALEALRAGVPSTELADLAATGEGRVTGEAVVEAVRHGDPLARAVWDQTMEMLGAGVASIINAFNPRRVVLGGGVTRAGDLLFEPVRRIALQRAIPALAEVVEITPAELGDRTGILGAVAVALARLEQTGAPSERAGRRDEDG
jgi:glucokinase